MKKVFKKILFSVMCFAAVVVIVTITGCDKDRDETKWEAANAINPNDKNNFYTYDEAMKAFGDKLPTKRQLQKMIDNFTWTWNNSKKGYDISNAIYHLFLPAAGYRDCDGDVFGVGSRGYYWSSSPYGTKTAWCLCFDSDYVFISGEERCSGRSVRLVRD